MRVDEIVNSVLSNLGNDKTQLDKINCEQKINNENEPFDNNLLTSDFDITKIIELMNKFQKTKQQAKMMIKLNYCMH